MSLEQITEQGTTTDKFLARNLEPTMAWTLANSAYLKLSDEALKFISANTGNLEEAATIGAYGILGTSLFYANKKLFNPLTKKIKEWKNRQISQGIDYDREKRKNVVQLTAIAGLFFISNMPGTLSNYKTDIDRATSIFTKKEQVQEVIPNEYASLNLEGRTLRNLFSLYTGAPEDSLVGSAIRTDFKAQLSELWNMKQAKAPGNPGIQQVIDAQVQNYESSTPTRMTFNEYLAEIRNTIKETKQNLDWEEVARIKRLSPGQGQTLKELSGKIDENALMSYALTELMPSHNGSLNIDVMDFLLRNAGREYVELIPALFDSETSFGLYQFTPHALYDNGEEARGASIINRALPEQKRIPGNVVSLQGNDHHRAAYLFAINNVADLIRNTNERQLNALLNYASNSNNGLTKYVATAHHRPRDALRAGLRWLDHDAVHPYTLSCNQNIIDYSRKTRENHNALNSVGGVALK